MNFLNELKYRIKYSDPVMKLILVNSVLFVFIIFFNVVLWMLKGDVSNSMLLKSTLALPANFIQFLSRPWTVITYQFTHFKLFHIIFNLIVLHLAGTVFLDFFKKKELWRVYILGGVTAGLLFVLGANFLPGFKGQSNIFLMGASASVLAVLFAATTYAPNVRITLFGVFEIKLLWFSLFFLLLALVSVVESNSGGHIAHIGGVLFGWLYAWYKKNSHQLNLFDKSLETKPRRGHLKVEINENKYKKNSVKNTSDISNRPPTQEEVDAILDKISKTGYDRLSKEEKDILFKASQE